MKKILRIIPIFCIGFLIAGYCVLRYNGKWQNYHDKALFLNTYGYSDDQSPGKFSWHWLPDPKPIFDGAGHVVQVDYESNMLAIIIYPGGDPQTFNYISRFGSFSTNIDKTKITIHQQNDTLLAITEQGFQSLKKFQPGEAKSIFSNLEQMSASSNKSQLQAAIMSLLGPAATQPATMAAMPQIGK